MSNLPFSDQQVFDHVAKVGYDTYRAFDSLHRTESLSPRTDNAILSAAEQRRLMSVKTTSQVYDFARWRDHRSGWMSLFCILTMFTSHTMYAIRWPLLWLALVSTLTALNFRLGDMGHLPWWLELPRVPKTMGNEPLALTSVAISLLLVFRTNSSYDRFSEARKLFGLMLNRSRDLMRQGISFFEKSKMQSKATLGRWIIVYTKALMCQMQSTCVLNDEAQPFLSDSELALMTSAKAPVITAIQVLSQLISAESISDMQRWQMYSNLTTFHDILGGCEKILHTPIPVAYSRHTVRCVMLWLTFFPYITYHSLQWFVIPATILAGVCLLGINAIGTDIEEPFSILPLEAITERARVDIIELINEHAQLQAQVQNCSPSDNSYLFRSISASMGSAPLQGIQVMVDDQRTPVQGSMRMSSQLVSLPDEYSDNMAWHPASKSCCARKL